MECIVLKFLGDYLKGFVLVAFSPSSRYLTHCLPAFLFLPFQQVIPQWRFPSSAPGSGQRAFPHLHAFLATVKVQQFLTTVNHFLMYTREKVCGGCCQILFLPFVTGLE
jgi:hypothetical protein